MVILLTRSFDDDDGIVPDIMGLTVVYSLYCYVFISIFHMHSNPNFHMRSNPRVP